MRKGAMLAGFGIVWLLAIFALAPSKLTALLALICGPASAYFFIEGLHKGILKGFLFIGLSVFFWVLALRTGVNAIFSVFFMFSGCSIFCLLTTNIEEIKS